MNLAFIGLGNMGGPMAANLVAAGHRVTGFDPVPVACAAARAAGVAVAESPAGAVAGAEAVITMLPNGEIVLDVYADLLPAAGPGALFVDSSTIAVAQAQQAAALAVAAGHRAVDAPVSGGVGGATAGTLTFMVGGPGEVVEAARAVLEPMAGRIVACGDSGAGQTAKLCNNLILGVSMAAVSEAFILGERLGLSHQALFDVASTSSGQCWALTSNCPVPGPVPASPANRDYQPGFAAALMNKDLGLALAAAREVGLDAALGTLAGALYRTMTDGEAGGRDFSAVIDLIRAESPRPA